ncbi:pyridoxamine 5'-phosphate oxidase family protein [Luteimicrobium subarcticum]|uniref:Pyridoxamine 5'-phosphate oxidase n=1 Tax=Luteimicrobium subarcticum TaxID=620910 RepID=A0A2M8WR27_9MICO|nr:pyridoxamine 5'-phosphate oxidase family protein [Luteimicrobium subarcticum]PJI93390.1 pyridoxamine 5'-phosphate oxidase [Luteimicrobium subarcticum]
MTAAQAPRDGHGDAVAGEEPLDLVGFVRANPRAVLTTVAVDGSPQAALLDVAVTDDGELVLDSLADARKVTNLRAEPRVALVVGVVRPRWARLYGTRTTPPTVRDAVSPGR